jgi:hypothetical protein
MTTVDTVAVSTPDRAPLATATARHLAVLLALVLLAAGIVALREASVVLGWVSGTAWFAEGLTAADGLRSQWWMVPIGCLVTLGGLWMVFAALRPRRKIAVAVDTASAVWMRPRDVAWLASYAAGSVPGVEVLTSEATRRRVTLYVGLTAVESVDGAKGAITAAVGSATEILDPPPQIRVRIATVEAT